MNSVYKLSSASSESVNQLLKALTSLFIALGLLAGCATSPKPENKDLRFFTGKAQVFDKNKNKVEWVYFNSTVRAPNQLRLDVSMGLLGLPLGTLVINGNEAMLVSVFEHKVYRTKNGDKVIEKLMKTNISSADIISTFSENFPLSAMWTCSGGDSTHSCKTDSIQLDWARLDKNDRKMTIDSPRSKVVFMYQPVLSGKDQFEVPVPMGFEVIEM